MKKLLFLIPFLFMACSEKQQISTQNETVDTLTHSKNGAIAGKRSDSVRQKKALREVSGSTVTKTITGAMLPMSIYEEFSNEETELIVKIINLTPRKISAAVTPENSRMNIRFNQVQLPDGSYDGPFGRKISVKLHQKGSVSLFIGKSNMASDTATGKFAVHLQ